MFEELIKRITTERLRAELGLLMKAGVDTLDLRDATIGELQDVQCAAQRVVNEIGEIGAGFHDPSGVPTFLTRVEELCSVLADLLVDFEDHPSVMGRQTRPRRGEPARPWFSSNEVQMPPDLVPLDLDSSSLQFRRQRLPLQKGRSLPILVAEGTIGRHVPPTATACCSHRPLKS